MHIISLFLFKDFFILVFSFTSYLNIGEGNGNPLQCSWLENPRDRGAWWAAICGVAQSWTRLKQLSSSSSSKYSLYYSLVNLFIESIFPRLPSFILCIFNFLTTVIWRSYYYTTFISRWSKIYITSIFSILWLHMIVRFARYLHWFSLG